MGESGARNWVVPLYGAPGRRSIAVARRGQPLEREPQPWFPLPICGVGRLTSAGFPLVGRLVPGEDCAGPHSLMSGLANNGDFSRSNDCSKPL